MRSPHHLFRARQREVCRLRIDQFCQTEISDLDASLRVDKNVLGLNVAMDDAFIVGVLKCFADLRDDRQSLCCVKAFGLHQLTQIGAVHEFHDEEVKLLALTKVKYVDDGRVTKPGHGSCLTREAFGKRGVVTQIGPHQLYGHKAIKLFLASLIHDAHTTDTNLFDDFQFRK